MVTNIIPTSAHAISTFERIADAERTEMTDAEWTLLAGIAEIIARARSAGHVKKKRKTKDVWKALTDQQIRFIEAYRGCSNEFLEQFLILLEGGPLPADEAIGTT